MAVPKLMVKCPLCREPIVAGATKCKHCHSDLSSLSSSKSSRFQGINTFRFGFLSGVLFTLALVLLTYLHCSSGN